MKNAAEFLDTGDTPGPKRRRSAVGSGLLANMKRMRVGDRHYIESTPEAYAAAQRNVGSLLSRKPDDLGGREYRTGLFTAVAAGRAADVRYLVCVERTK